mmetsp:Transcript_76411/g.218805  ORF Transcript_76411/g.218805 Transcript_76411/m.218805 type:complete len:253 (-) Transcript_76411:162-920(-)
MAFVSISLVAYARIQLVRTIITGLVLPAFACGSRTAVLELLLPRLETGALKTGQSHSEIDAMLSQLATALELMLNVTPTVILFKSFDGIGAALAGAAMMILVEVSGKLYFVWKFHSKDLKAWWNKEAQVPTTALDPAVAADVKQYRKRKRLAIRFVSESVGEKTLIILGPVFGWFLSGMEVGGGRIQHLAMIGIVYFTAEHFSDAGVMWLMNKLRVDMICEMPKFDAKSSVMAGLLMAALVMTMKAAAGFGT